MISRCVVTLTLLICYATISHSRWWWAYWDKKPWDAYDNVGLNNKHTVRNMSHELLTQAYLKTRHILDIRDYHSGSIAYEVGYLMGKVREKYRRMMEHYYQWRDNAKGKSAHIGPGVRDVLPIHFLLAMEHIFTYEADIHKYCDVLLQYFLDDDTPVPGGSKFNQEMLEKKKAKMIEMKNLMKEKNAAKEAEEKQKKEAENAAAAAKDLPEDVKQQMIAQHQQQALKSRYRRQHLMRRLGLPENYTTRSKRFRDNWPVEGTWDFGPYDVGI